MDELEFYDGLWAGQQIDAGISLAGTLADALAIVVDGKQSAIGAEIGQYIVVKNSTISGAADGLYTAAKTIPANTAIDATYLTAVSGGGLNDLNTALQSLPKFTTFELSANTDPGDSFYIPSGYRGLMVLIASGNPDAHGIITVSCTSGSTVRFSKLNGAGYTISAGTHALIVKSGNSPRIMFITYSDTITPYLITEN